jgi:AcrR family transcriptional regulator
MRGVQIMPTYELKAKSRKARRRGTDGGLNENSGVNGRTDSNKRQMIISKAITMFANLGYDNVRISDITDSIDIAKGTLYLYFKTKKDLLLECFGELNRLLETLESREEIRNEKDIPVKNTYRWMGFAERYSDFGGILNVLRTACRSQDEEIRLRAMETYDIIIEPLRRDIKSAIENGAICNVDPEISSYYLLGAAESLAFLLETNKRYTIKEIGEMVYYFNRKTLALDISGEHPENPKNNIIGKISDKCGTTSEIRQIRFGENTFLSGKFGQGEIFIDPSKISRVDVNQVNSQWSGRVCALDGTCKEIELDGETVISGESALGTFRIPFKNVSSITF